MGNHDVTESINTRVQVEGKSKKVLTQKSI